MRNEKIGAIKSPEEVLIDEARKTIYKNLATSGLATQLVAKSNHAVDEFGPWAYPEVALNYEVGRYGTVDIWPVLRQVEASQPVTLKLDRLFGGDSDADAKQEAAAQKIWEGVTQEQKNALAAAAINKLLDAHKAEIAFWEPRKRDEGDEEIFGDVQKRLKRLMELDAALKDRGVDMRIEKNCAVLEVLPRTEKF